MGYKKKTILHISTLHPRNDTRIFVKQIRTLESMLENHVTLVVADGEGDQTFEDKNINIKDIGKIKGNRIIRILKSLITSYFYIRKVNPIVIHFHDPEIIPLGIIFKLLGYKVIYDVHEDFGCVAFSREWIPWVIRFPLKISIRFAEHLGAKFFDANIAATKSISTHFPKNKTIIVQNFPIIDELVAPRKINFRNRAKSVAYVGYATSNRGAREMVQAIAELSFIDDLTFEFAGSIDPPTLEKELTQTSGWEFVNYHGHISRKFMANILGNTRAGLVVFHPSPNHIQAQPTKLFEYMAAGLPVIASDFPLWREIIDKAKCGILVNPLSPGSIANAIKWILSNPVDAEQMGCNGNRAVQDIFNWRKEGEKLVGLYNRLLS